MKHLRAILGILFACAALYLVLILWPSQVITDKDDQCNDNDINRVVRFIACP